MTSKRQDRIVAGFFIIVIFIIGISGIIKTLMNHKPAQMTQREQMIFYSGVCLGWEQAMKHPECAANKVLDNSMKEFLSGTNAASYERLPK